MPCRSDRDACPGDKTWFWALRWYNDHDLNAITSFLVKFFFFLPLLSGVSGIVDGFFSGVDDSPLGPAAEGG
eukprot:SAG22_NODE_307_length_12666_cov_761.250259_8_plen_72_part_00